MKCSCGADTIVKDSRIISEGQWRKRYCGACDTAFTTLEQVCETIKNTRPKTGTAVQYDIKVIRPPKVIVDRPKRERKAKQAPAVGKVIVRPAPVEPQISARRRIEDMKLERELIGEE